MQVRESEVSSATEDVETLKKVIHISKLDPLTPEFVPQNVDSPSPTPVMAPKLLANKKKSAKQSRNVALTSILELVGTEPEVEKGMEPMRLTNSVDFSTNMTASVKKVNGWLEAQQQHDTRDAKNILSSDPGLKKKISPVKETDKCVDSMNHTKLVQPPTKDVNVILSLDPSTMFRKKVPTKVVAECNKDTVKLSRGCVKYVPSSNANEHYKKYLERSKVLAMVNDDVWTRAERKMREIDDRRLVLFCKMR